MPVLRNARTMIGIALGMALSTVASAQAQRTPQTTEPGQRSADEVARELANPNTALGSLAFPIDYTRFGGDLDGAGQQNGFRISFQPSLPVPLAPGLNFFARPLVPIIVRQPVPLAGGGFESHGLDLGDIGFDSAVGRSFPNGLILVGGMVGSMPTATDGALGLGHWTLGPEALVGLVTPRLVVGALVTQSWNVGSDTKTNITGGQYFHTINLRNAWQVTGSPTFSYNHEAPSGSRLSLPLAIGVNKTVIRGSTPWKLSVQHWYYAWRPEAFGARHQLRFTITPVVPLPW